MVYAALTRVAFGTRAYSVPRHIQSQTSRMAAKSQPITISSLTHLSSNELAELLLDPEKSSGVVVVDVRDSDHMGGNIKGSEWIPVNELDLRMPEMLRRYNDKQKVVFHCMLSQQRGPQAALKFARAKQAKDEKEKKDTSAGAEVCILDGGFGMWQARFGPDERLTQDYVEDIWLD